MILVVACKNIFDISFKRKDTEYFKWFIYWTPEFWTSISYIKTSVNCREKEDLDAKHVLYLCFLLIEEKKLTKLVGSLPEFNWCIKTTAQNFTMSGNFFQLYVLKGGYVWAWALYLSNYPP